MPYFGTYFGTGAFVAPPSGLDASPSRLGLQYCTDEDIAERAPEDFAALAPRAIRLAVGTNGAFAGASRWTLTSITNAFATQGCGAGNVCLLGPAPKATFGKIAGGHAYAVNAASDSGLQLRHVGQALGRGVPPSPAGGLTGVEFTVPTFAPAIDQASREANRLYGIDPDRSGRTPLDLKPSSLEDLRQWTALSVLLWAYAAADKVNDSDFKLKLSLIAAKLEKVQSRLAMLWGPTGEAKAPTSYFSAKVVR